ncbi:hypothetical protein M9Y10_019063 [Tritrichomonas musculus]|uniref:Uncharacterized protein n=1 Tax=Tritrichomonas musculus TaxID=1915356 RepID=A0ABR2HIH8_9EUKA
MNSTHTADNILSSGKFKSQEIPLQGETDLITGDKMEMPTISPDGYVLDYKTWLKIIETNSKNQFTMKPISLSQLVILTNDNFEEYRNKIKNYKC